MAGGVISDNRSAMGNSGGCVGGVTAIFNKTGGIIYGNDGGENSNIGGYIGTAAAAVNGKWRALTAWETTNLSTGVTGGSTTGEWDN